MLTNLLVTCAALCSPIAIWALNKVLLLNNLLPYIRRRADVQSHVPDHEGPAICVWRNTNQIMNRLDHGVTGFFRLARPVLGGLLWVSCGPEFHGIAPYGSSGREVWSTMTPDPWEEYDS